MATLPLLERLKDQATQVGRRLGKAALDELLTREQQHDAIELAAKGVQEGRRLFDSQFEKLFAALGLATQADLARLARKIGILRRRLEALVDDVDAAAEATTRHTPLFVESASPSLAKPLLSRGTPAARQVAAATTATPTAPPKTKR